MQLYRSKKNSDIAANVYEILVSLADVVDLRICSYFSGIKQEKQEQPL